MDKKENKTNKTEDVTITEEMFKETLNNYILAQIKFKLDKEE